MTDTGDDLTALRGRLPQARPLPQQPAHRAGLMAVLSGEPSATAAQQQTFRFVRPAARRWLSPVAAAVAVGAIAVAVTLPNLIGSTSAPPSPRSHPHHLGHGLPGHGHLGHGHLGHGHLVHGPRPAGLHWQVPLAGLREVVVRTSAGAVTVKAAPPGQNSVTVSAKRHFSGPAPVISSKVVAGVLEVRGKCPPTNSHRHCTVSFTVRLPRALAVRVNDPLGTVRLVGLSGPVTVTADLGNIEGVGLTSPNANLTADLGDINVAFTAPPTRLVATGQEGNVTLRVPATTVYHVTAQAQLGNTTVTVPTSPSAVHIIRATSQLGNVSVTD